MSTLGRRLKAARERMGWTQTYVCKKLGIPNSTLSGYERDYRNPDPELLAKLAELYEVSTDYLLGRTDDPKRTVLDEVEVDIKAMIEALKEGKALWGGRKLNKEESEILSSILLAVLEREKRLYNERKKRRGNKVEPPHSNPPK